MHNLETNALLTCQHRAPAGATHGRGDVSVVEGDALLAEVPVQLRHELQRPELDILEKNTSTIKTSGARDTGQTMISAS